jgi:putative heme iron utilization protein
MDPESELKLAHMIRQQRIAALGTLHDGAPFVSMVAYAPAADFAAFYIHASRLSQHTRDLLQNPQVSLMIVETDPGAGDPQTLARVSLMGMAAPLAPDAADYAAIRALYQARFPASTLTFQLGDFALYRITVTAARYVAGLGKAFSLRSERLQQAAKVV